MPYTMQSIPIFLPCSSFLSFFLFFSRSKYQSQKLPVILRESLDKRGKLERWMRVSWQIHDVNTFVSPSKWAAVSSLPNKCQPNKTSWLHTNAITGRIPGEEKRQRGPTGRKTHCLSTARPVCTISRTYDSTLHEINYPLFFPSNHRQPTGSILNSGSSDEQPTLQQ